MESTLLTICPRSSAPFYIVTYNIKWATTSWTDGILTLYCMGGGGSTARRTPPPVVVFCPLLKKILSQHVPENSLIFPLFVVDAPLKKKKIVLPPLRALLFRVDK